MKEVIDKAVVWSLGISHRELKDSWGPTQGGSAIVGISHRELKEIELVKKRESLEENLTQRIERIPPPAYRLRARRISHRELKGRQHTPFDRESY